MPISLEYMRGLSPGQQMEVKRLLEEQAFLAQELWRNHREQDAMIAEISLARSQTPIQVRCEMAQPPQEHSPASP